MNTHCLLDKPIILFLTNHNNSTLGDIRKHLKTMDIVYAPKSKSLERRLRLLISKKMIVKKRLSPFSYPVYNLRKK